MSVKFARRRKKILIYLNALAIDTQYIEDSLTKSVDGGIILLFFAVKCQSSLSVNSEYTLLDSFINMHHNIDWSPLLNARCVGDRRASKHSFRASHRLEQLSIGLFICGPSVSC